MLADKNESCDMIVHIGVQRVIVQIVRTLSGRRSRWGEVLHDLAVASTGTIQN